MTMFQDGIVKLREKVWIIVIFIKILLFGFQHLDLGNKVVFLNNQEVLFILSKIHDILLIKFIFSCRMKNIFRYYFQLNL